jgi:hypothetical protein
MKNKHNMIEIMVPYLDDNEHVQVHRINTRHVSYSGRNGISIGQKLTLIDPHKESEDNPLFVYARGFYNDALFLADDEHILETRNYRKVLESDRTFLSQSKYPHTEDLRDYNNWLFFSQMKRKKKDIQALSTHAMDMRMMHGIDVSYLDLTLFHNMNVSSTSRQQGAEFIPRHLHYDDFVEKWNGKIQIRLAANLYSNATRYDAIGNKYGGIVIDTNWKPGMRRSPLDGVEWFNNIEFGYYHGDSIWSKTVNDLFDYAGHPDVNIYAVLDREKVGRHGTLEMWDPVKDIVKVEKILGNVSFLSEFGYICTMSKYNLIVGDTLEMKRKYCLI